MGVSIDTGGGGGKKKLDAELNLVPFIDLLVVNICFLLMTAVWTQMARINVNQKQPSSQSPEDEPPPEKKVKLAVVVEDGGYTLVADLERISIPKQGDHYDQEALAKHLKEVKTRLPDKTDIQVGAEDDIHYDHVIGAMDTALANGFPDIQLSDATL